MKAPILGLALMSLFLVAAAESSDLKSASALEELSKQTFQINRPLTLEEKRNIRDKCEAFLKIDLRNLEARRLLEYIWENEGPRVCIVGVRQDSDAEKRVFQILAQYCFTIDAGSNAGGTSISVGEHLAEPMRIQLAKAALSENLNITLFERSQDGVHTIQLTPQMVLSRNSHKAEQGAAANP